MLNWLVDKLIERAKRTPYFHLYHADGRPYMERYWLVGDNEMKHRFSVRLHWIATEDVDRDMHDHPWSYVSIVLRGWYFECFPTKASEYREDGFYTCKTRYAGSIAFRPFTHRHRIIEVPKEGTWTLFVTFPKRQTWGYFTPVGKIWWWQYRGKHNTAPIAGDTLEDLR